MGFVNSFKNYTMNKQYQQMTPSQKAVRYRWMVQKRVLFNPDKFKENKGLRLVKLAFLLQEWRSRDELIKVMGISYRHLHRYLNELIFFGFEIEQLRTYPGHYKIKNFQEFINND